MTGSCSWSCHRRWRWESMPTLRLSQVAMGEYANFAIITHSSSDFIVDFARVMPGLPKAQVRSRVILAPEHAKRLLAALQENIMRYENEFGPIRIPNKNAPDIVPPFNIPKGEA